MSSTGTLTAETEPATIRNRILSSKLMVAQLVKKFPAFYGTRWLAVVYGSEPYPAPLESITGGPTCDSLECHLLSARDLPGLRNAHQTPEHLKSLLLNTSVILNIHLTNSVGTALRKKLTVVNLSTTFTEFMEPEYSLQYSQKPVTYPYVEPHESCPRPTIPHLKSILTFSSPSTPRPAKCFFPSGFSSKILSPYFKKTHGVTL